LESNDRSESDYRDENVTQVLKGARKDDVGMKEKRAFGSKREFSS
jgi:hypothetical protein